MASNPSPESGASLWLSVGRLQSDTARLIEGQTEHRAGLIELRQIGESTRLTGEWTGCFTPS